MGSSLVQERVCALHEVASEESMSSWKKTLWHSVSLQELEPLFGRRATSGDLSEGRSSRSLVPFSRSLDLCVEMLPTLDLQL